MPHAAPLLGRVTGEAAPTAGISVQRRIFLDVTGTGLILVRDDVRRDRGNLGPDIGRVLADPDGV